MNIILENIRKVLLENRIDDVKNKYPNVNPNLINYFVEKDPSGNQKYLEWLVKAMNHNQTLEKVYEILSENPNLAYSPQEFLMNLVKKFHELLPYLVHVEGGKKVGTTDLYQYKFTDSDMINYLGYDLDLAKQRKEEKDKEKDAKKNSDIIYKDRNWLVVRPKTWQASCVYGAGTKWCTTSKETDTHFDRETDRNFLIYVIDRNKTKESDTYKVAWQIPYSRDVFKKYVDDSGDDFNINLTGGIKLWNAKDDNIANGIQGKEYLNLIPKSLKKIIFGYMGKTMENLYDNLAYVDDPHEQALIEHLGITDEFVDDINRENWDYYGLKVYEFSGNRYAVADMDEVDDANEQSIRSYYEDVGVEGLRNIEYYIKIRDVDSLAEEETNYYIDELSNDELVDDIDRVSVTDEHRESLIERYRENIERIENIDDQINELNGDDEIELERLKEEKGSIEEENGRIINEIRSIYWDILYKDKVDEMTNDPIDWLWNMGYYSKRDGLDKRAIDSGLVEFDEESLVNDTIRDSGYEFLGEYNEIRINDETYFIIRI